MPLPDGTNKEGEDLSTPLSSSINSLDNLHIVLYGTHASPATCKTRALLNLAGIPYERKFGKKSDSSYQKYPVVVLKSKQTEQDDDDDDVDKHQKQQQQHKQQQINDSHIIYKNLAPILFPTTVTSDTSSTTTEQQEQQDQNPSQQDIDIEKEVTFGLMLACEVQAFQSSDCMKRWATTAGVGSGVSGFFIRTMTPFSLAQKGADRIAANNPNLQTPVEYCRKLQQELEKRGTLYFDGDDAPGPLDASVYGAIAVWAPIGNGTTEYQIMPFMADALKESGLEQWYQRMGERIPNMWEKKGIWPFYT